MVSAFRKKNVSNQALARCRVVVQRTKPGSLEAPKQGEGPALGYGRGAGNCFFPYHCTMLCPYGTITLLTQ